MLLLSVILTDAEKLAVFLRACAVQFAWTCVPPATAVVLMHKDSLATKAVFLVSALALLFVAAVVVCGALTEWVFRRKSLKKEDLQAMDAGELRKVLKAMWHFI